MWRLKYRLARTMETCERPATDTHLCIQFDGMTSLCQSEPATIDNHGVNNRYLRVMLQSDAMGVHL
jgi:hypothetical protein